jgi:glucosylglycerate phosphorylase
MKYFSKQTTFLNVLGTHDGVGVAPATGILTQNEVNYIAGHIKERGGFISYKARKDGSTIPYELNISYYSAISDPGKSIEVNCKKYISSQVIMLSLAGIPGIYIHSLFGTENDLEEVQKTGQKRKINRKKYFYTQLAKKLSDSSSKEYRIYQDYLKIIKKRKYEKSFHPNGKQEAIFLKKSIFSIIRTSPDNKEKIIVLLNVTGKKQFIPISRAWHVPANEKYYDIISEKVISINDSFQLGPYQFIWLKKEQ